MVLSSDYNLKSYVKTNKYNIIYSIQSSYKLGAIFGCREHKQHNQPQRLFLFKILGVDLLKG